MFKSKKHPTSQIRDFFCINFPKSSHESSLDLAVGTECIRHRYVQYQQSVRVLFRVGTEDSKRNIGYAFLCLPFESIELFFYFQHKSPHRRNYEKSP